MPIFEEYKRERRILEIPNFRREDLGTVIRYTPNNSKAADGIVCFAKLTEAELDDEILRHTAHFDAIGTGFEWKVYDSDEPKCLREKLVGAGFQQEDPEILMSYEVAKFRSAPKSSVDEIKVRRVENIELLKHIAEFQELIWGKSFTWLPDQLLSTWNQCVFFSAYHDRRLVGTGWIEYPERSQFAELHGGAVLPGYRGRGIYSRLFRARMTDALARGIKWVTVDAAPMSRPILESKGFARLDTTYPITWVSRHTARG
jgi:GNAT superfamily N-acetyltransferase